MIVVTEAENAQSARDRTKTPVPMAQVKSEPKAGRSHGGI